jgi:hypothetical protein
MRDTDTDADTRLTKRELAAIVIWAALNFAGVFAMTVDNWIVQSLGVIWVATAITIAGILSISIISNHGRP